MPKKRRTKSYKVLFYSKYDQLVLHSRLFMRLCKVLPNSLREDEGFRQVEKLASEYTGRNFPGSVSITGVKSITVEFEEGKVVDLVAVAGNSRKMARVVMDKGDGQ